MAGAFIIDGYAQPTADKPLELKLATHALPTHFLIAKGVFPEWAQRIEKETGGRIKIKIFDSQSLGKLPDEWAKERDAKGLPETEILNFARGFLGK